MVELENEYDCNFSIMDIPVEEMEDVYTQMLNDHNSLRDAALASTPLLNEPVADEEEAVQFVAPLCHHEGCSNQFQAGGVSSRHGAKQRACRMKGCTCQAQKEGVLCQAWCKDQML